MAAAGRGDQDACRALVERHLPAVVALARRTLGNQAEAEDVGQDAFLRVWRAAPSWQPRAKFTTWLHRVTVNLCLDRLRRKTMAAIDEMPEMADPKADSEAAATDRQVAGQVEEALRKLPERQRLAIVLCHYQGLSQAEAAAALEIGVEALESLLARGRRKLKELLRVLADDVLHAG